jgi:hypothetical protein
MRNLTKIRFVPVFGEKSVLSVASVGKTRGIFPSNAAEPAVQKVAVNFFRGVCDSRAGGPDAYISRSMAEPAVKAAFCIPIHTGQNAGASGPN